MAGPALAFAWRVPTNREIAEATFAAFQRGDLDAAFEHAAPDSVFENRTEAPGAEGTWVGREGFMEMLGRIVEAFSEYSFELLETRELDDGRIALLLEEHVRGRSSGVPAKRRIVTAYTIEDGLITRIDSYVDR
jgi:ketosteroid isomerase-like protein